MTGDPWASLTDLISAGQAVEAAIHGADPRMALAHAAQQVQHAHDYYQTAGYTDLAAEAAAVAQQLQAWSRRPPADLYAAIWGQPVRWGTLAHLWRRATALTSPDPLWVGWLGLGLSVGSLAAIPWLTRRRP
jgi:hypothetical protein